MTENRQESRQRLNYPVTGTNHEEFYAKFNLGSDDRRLSPSDLAGTAVASVQALHGENITLRNEIAALKKEYRF